MYEGLFFDFTLIDDELYYVSRCDGFIEKCALQDGAQADIVAVPNVMRKICMLSSWNHYLFALDFADNEMLRYDVDNNELISIQNVLDVNLNADFTDFFTFENYLVVVPKFNNTIYFIETETCLVDCLTITDMDAECGLRGVQHDHYYWLLGISGDSAWRVDLKKREVKRYMIGKKLSGVRDCVIENNTIWILAGDNAIYEWNIKTQILNMRYTFPDLTTFFRFISTDKSFVILPNKQCDPIQIIDRESGKTSIYSAYPEGFEYLYQEELRQSAYDRKKIISDKCFFAQRTSSHMLAVNLKSGDLKWYKIIQPKEDERLAGRLIRYKNPVYEGKYTLKDMIKGVASLDLLVEK